MYHTKLYRLL